MYSFSLNGTKVKEPIGFGDMVLKKTVSDLYGGFIAGSFGFIEGVGGLTFTEVKAVEIIDTEISTTDGKVEAVIMWCEDVIFEGVLDLASAEKVNCNYNVQILSNDKRNEFISKHEVIFGITPNRRIKLEKKEYYTGGYVYTIGDNDTYVATTDGIELDIAVPFVITETVTPSGGHVPYVPPSYNPPGVEWGGVDIGFDTGDWDITDPVIDNDDDECCPEIYVGNVSATSIVEHKLETTNPLVEIYSNSDDERVYTTFSVIDENNIKINIGEDVEAGEYRVVVVKIKEKEDEIP